MIIFYVDMYICAWILPQMHNMTVSCFFLEDLGMRTRYMFSTCVLKSWFTFITSIFLNPSSTLKYSDLTIEYSELPPEIVLTINQGTTSLREL